MIARSWNGRVPQEHAGCFHRHLLKTGVSDYRQQPGCLEVRLWRSDADRWASFLLLSVWRDLDAIRAYAGSTPEVAVLYPEDDAFGLVPDKMVMHYRVLSMEPSDTECVAWSTSSSHRARRARRSSRRRSRLPGGHSAYVSGPISCNAAEQFTAWYPARTTEKVKELPPSALVEIEMIARTA
ncbi:antibiotic biosynthesis monooxygenase [Hydrogenophaga sp. A37]|uniref:antibiotic biosynthesis monooxygenase n=1 Tax=Hydrogenophaga sp. A37 TaxID=1945864 RepID=UPI0009861F99|nr:antibiotic biosynthesis monooxygenase [Hydrogenophaga sp. A37]OOG82413.1 hypothetical protein B0E41_15290 [Hydrogenophaga sp. A37]